MSEQLNSASTLITDLDEPFQSIIELATREEATDVHIDPGADGFSVRFRVDGVIHEKDLDEIEDSLRLINQVKLAAQLDIDRSFVPLEANIHLADSDGKGYEIRATLSPVKDTMAIHLRFLKQSRRVRQLSKLGFEDADLETVSTVIKQKSGLILVSGATGSGKSTTLYALAAALNLRSRVTISIEDPVEFRIPDIRQLEVDHQHDLTMIRGLKTLLRMDPDVILVGEIRDHESAVTAARAALTGQLVIATIHAPDDLTVLEALRYFDVPRYVIGGALRLIIVQDLIRRLCTFCRREIELSEAHKAMFEAHGVNAPDGVFEPVGCDKCNQYGYKGSIGVFEVTPLNRDLGHQISHQMKWDTLRDIFADLRSSTMIAGALRKAAEGIVSMSDVTDLEKGRWGEDGPH